MEELLTTESGAVAWSAPVALQSLTWLAVRVRSRHEKVVSAALRGKGLEEFAALRPVLRRWSDRVCQVELPLFPGYVFCRCDPSHLLPVVTCPGVVSVVSFANHPCPVSANEIEAIRSAVRSGLPLEPWEHIQIGRRARIKHGCLAGLEGIVLRRRNKVRLILSVSLLQRSVALEIDAFDVEPA